MADVVFIVSSERVIMNVVTLSLQRQLWLQTRSIR